jgi:hypothetical protein
MITLKNPNMNNNITQPILRDTVSLVLDEMEAPEILLECLLDALEWSHDWFRNKPINDDIIEADNHFMLQSIIWEVALPWLQSPRKPPIERLVVGIKSILDYMDHAEFQKQLIAFTHQSFTFQFGASILGEESLMRANKLMGLFIKMDPLANKYFLLREQLHEN